MYVYLNLLFESVLATIVYVSTEFRNVFISTPMTRCWFHLYLAESITLSWSQRAYFFITLPLIFAYLRLEA